MIYIKNLRLRDLFLYVKLDRRQLHFNSTLISVVLELGKPKILFLYSQNTLETTTERLSQKFSHFIVCQTFWL